MSTATPESIALQEAIDHLYRVFKRYCLKSPVDGCYVSADEAAALKSKPLGRLLASDMGRYLSSALTTWGSLDDFKHFLPRICELIAARQCGNSCLEIVLGKLGYGEWTGWLLVERQAVRKYLGSLWERALTLPIEVRWQCDVDELLCGIAAADENVSGYLRMWRSRPDLQTALHLARFMDHNQGSLVKNRSLKNAFWSESGNRAIIAWLCEPATNQQLEAAFFLAADESTRAVLSQAAEHWTWIKTRCA